MNMNTVTSRIIYSHIDGSVSVIIPSGEIPFEEVIKDVPVGLDYKIVTIDEVPTDRTFRGAWVMGDRSIVHDIDKCKDIAHKRRRSERNAELAPLDEVIMKQIPGNDFIAVEASRQVIRDKYAKIQEDIDLAKTPEEIKTALKI